METTIVYWGYIEIMETKMETTIVYWGYIAIMENKMETTIVSNPCSLLEKDVKMQLKEPAPDKSPAAPDGRWPQRHGELFTFLLPRVLMLGFYYKSEYGPLVSPFLGMVIQANLHHRKNSARNGNARVSSDVSKVSERHSKYPHSTWKMPLLSEACS